MNNFTIDCRQMASFNYGLILLQSLHSASFSYVPTPNSSGKFLPSNAKYQIIAILCHQIRVFLRYLLVALDSIDGRVAKRLGAPETVFTISIFTHTYKRLSCAYRERERHCFFTDFR